jgi:DNA-binding XRE family transcriptional regulator
VSAKPGPKRKADPAKVMELRNQGMTQNEVAKALNIARQRVSQIETEANASISDNITNTSISPKTRDRGTSKDYHDRRLKKEAPAAYLRLSTGNRMTTPPAAWPAWPPWGVWLTLAATHAFHRASRAA